MSPPETVRKRNVEEAMPLYKMSWFDQGLKRPARKVGWKGTGKKGRR